MQFQRHGTRSRAVAWAIAAMLPAIAGCPEKKPVETNSAPLPFAGLEIRIAVPRDMGFRPAWESPLNEWEAQTGARYHLDEIAPPGAGEPCTLFSGEHPPTLAIFPLERAGELIASGALAPLPPSARGEGDEGVNWHDLYRGLREKIAARKGQPQFLPLAAPVLVCCYREDLLSAAGLKAPQTWDEYQALLDQLDRWAPEHTAVEPWGDEFRATMFLARAVSSAQHPGNYSLYFDIDTGDPLIDGPPFVRALEAAVVALKKMPADVARFRPADCRQEVVNGRAALAIVREPPEFAAPDETHTQTAAAGNPDGVPQIGVVRLPGSREVYDGSRKVWEPLPDKGISRVTLTAFAGWGIGAASSATSGQIDAAWNSLLKVGGPDLVSGFPLPVIGLCRDSQLTGQAPSAGLPGAAAGASTLTVAESLRDSRLVAELPVAGRYEFKQALSRGLGAAIEGSKSAEEALRSVAASWRETITRIGKDQHRDNYRSSLGLSPKPRE